jgi:small-conductance mechanosensitive channel
VNPARADRLCTRAWLPLLLILTLAGPASAQSAPEPPSSEAVSVAEEQTRESLASERQALGSEIEQARQRAAETPEGSAAHSIATEQVQSLERLDRLLAQQAFELDRADELSAAGQRVEEQLAAGPDASLAEPPPYSFGLYDALSDALEAQEGRLEVVEGAAQAAESALRAAGEEIDRHERQRRKLKEESASASGEVEAAGFRDQLRLLGVQLRRAQARERLAELQLANARSDVEIQQASIALVRNALGNVRVNLALSPDDLAPALASMDEEEFRLKEALEAAEREEASSEKRLARIQQRLDSDPEPSSTLEAQGEARRLAQEVAERRVAFLGERLHRLEEIRRLWEERVEVLAGEGSRRELRLEYDALRENLESLQHQQRFHQALLSELTAQLESTRSSAERARAAGRADAGWLETQSSELEELVTLYEAELASLGRAQALAGRALRELDERLASQGLGERLAALFERTTAGWETEVFVVDDNAITVGKLATALLLFVIGFQASRIASRLLARLLSRRTSLDAGAADAIRGLSFYALLVVFFLFALRSVNIPLTVFTILGGALAIGVGFGSQNIVNNFISGLILLVERPISTQDIVEVEGTLGQVERIGARSTRIRTFDNIHIIVPNSAFLENSVVNWTLADDVVRCRVQVGVAYGSDTLRVEQLMKRALTEHGQILEDPEPTLLFSEFGDNALGFDAYFWIRVRDLLDRRRIESDVRHRFDHLFREAGVVVAFPQRDVHLDTARPLEVRVVGELTSAD